MNEIMNYDVIIKQRIKNFENSYFLYIYAMFFTACQNSFGKCDFQGGALRAPPRDLMGAKSPGLLGLKEVLCSYDKFAHHLSGFKLYRTR